MGFLDSIAGVSGQVTSSMLSDALKEYPELIGKAIEGMDTGVLHSMLTNLSHDTAPPVEAVPVEGLHVDPAAVQGLVDQFGGQVHDANSLGGNLGTALGGSQWETVVDTTGQVGNAIDGMHDQAAHLMQSSLPQDQARGQVIEQNADQIFNSIQQILQIEADGAKSTIQNMSDAGDPTGGGGGGGHVVAMADHDAGSSPVHTDTDHTPAPAHDDGAAGETSAA